MTFKNFSFIDACRRSGASDLLAIHALASQRLGFEGGTPRAPLVPARDEAVSALASTLEGLMEGLPAAG